MSISARERNAEFGVFGGCQKAYRAAPGVVWVTHGNGILIIDEAARRSELLSYPEAAVWDMACRDHHAASIEAGLRWIMGDDLAPGSDIVRENLNRWIRDGLLVGI